MILVILVILVMKNKKHKTVNLQKLLLNPVAPQPSPESFYTIEAPDSFNFPIESTFLENIKIIEQYYPSDLNKAPSEGSPPLELFNHKHTLCMQKAKGLTIGHSKLKIEGITAFAYDGAHLMVALENRALAIYGADLKLVKEINNFSEKVIRLIHIVPTPAKFDGILVLTSSGTDLTVRRIEKTFFSTLSCKFSKELMRSKDPYVQFVELPKVLKRKYFQEDGGYKSSIIVACLSCTQITLLKINVTNVTSQNFVDIVYNKSHQNKYLLCYSSWGEARINSKDNDVKGVRLVLTYSFGKELYLLCPTKTTTNHEAQPDTRIQWLQSFPLLHDKDIIFCQYIKQNQVILITEGGGIVIFYTGTIEFFEKQTLSSDLDLIPYEGDKFKPKYVFTGSEVEVASYTTSFAYEYGTSEIHYLAGDKVGILVYCNWSQICELLTQASNYESAMNFLIALYNKANRFDLGFKHTPESFSSLSQYIQKIAMEYVQTKFGKYKQLTEAQLISKLSNGETIDVILTPLELLTTTREYTFLFQKLKPAIQEFIPQSAFYKALEPFISYGRLKYIPDVALKHTLDYYIKNQQSQIVQRLAIHFDLKQVEKGIVIKCCLDNILVVSLAFICTQGNQSEFVTPFVKFWGIAQNYKRNDNTEYAQYFCMRALWYVKLCLQRSMALKTYSYERFAYMISILTSHFFTETMICGLLKIRTDTTLESLSHYFSIQNASIVNEFCKLKIAASIAKLSWIESVGEREKLEMMLSAISVYVESTKEKRETPEEKIEDEQLFYLFLSRIILFKTIKFIQQKYVQILEFLIRNYACIRLINYGVDRLQGQQDLTQQEDQIKSSEYINKILILSIQEGKLDKKDLNYIFEISRLASLTQLQAQIKYIAGSYGPAIDIYLMGSSKAKQMVFPFLENSFKILKLEKKKKEKRMLEKEVKDKITSLIALDPERTTKVVKTYMPESQDELILALSCEESLQLEYLQELVSTSSPLSEQSLLIYIQLMSKLKPQNLLERLKSHTHYPVQQSVRICSTYQVYDCLEYLYERMGNIQESVKIAMLRVDQILVAKHTVQETDSMDPYVKVAGILSNVLSVCVKNKSEEVWEQLFDSAISLFYKYKNSPLYNEQIVVLYQVNSKILYQLLNHCSLQRSTYLIRQKYGKLDLGGSMNKAFIQVLSNYGFNENIMFSARDLNRASLSHFNYMFFQNNIHGYCFEAWCDQCGECIDKAKKCLSFYCGHCYHKECVVPSKEDGKGFCIRCLSGELNQFKFYISGGAQNKTKINKMMEEASHLRQATLSNFKKEEETYIQQKQEREHENVVSSKLERMRAYEVLRSLVDDTNNKVHEQLERSSRGRKRTK